MKRLIFVIILSASSVYGMSQEKQDTCFWKKGGTTSVSFSQTSLANWSGGGDNALSVNLLFDLFAKYNKSNTSWENILAMEYGLVKQGDEGVRKSIDKIGFSTKLGVKGKGFWYYTALLDFKTQFYKGYNYPNKVDIVSDLMSPAYLVLSVGMDYKPNDMFSAYLSPLTSKMTFVSDNTLSDAGAFGVDPGDKFRSEFGAYAKFTINKDVWDNVNLKSTLDLFTGYADNFGNIDVVWEVAINMKVNDFLTATVNTSLIYDDDTDYINSSGVNKGPKVQFKEIIGVGLAYKF